MNSQVNSLSSFQVQPNILTANQFDNIRVSPFLQANTFDLSSIFINTPKVTVPQPTTYGLHDEHEQETGETVSFDPTDPGSLFAAAEQLAKSPSSQDKLKAQELFMKFQELLQLQIQQASLLHQLAMSAINAIGR